MYSTDFKRKICLLNSCAAVKNPYKSNALHKSWVVAHKVIHKKCVEIHRWDNYPANFVPMRCRTAQMSSLHYFYACIEFSSKSNTCLITSAVAHNLIHILCAELHSCPHTGLKNIRIAMISPHSLPRAGILRRRTILIEINELTAHPMPCSQSYQQNMGTTFAYGWCGTHRCAALFLSLIIFAIEINDLKWSVRHCTHNCPQKM